MTGELAMDEGNALADRGDFSGAMEAFRRAKEQGAAGADLNLGNSYWALGDTQNAIAAFENGWRSGDNDAGFNLASLLESHGLDTARAIYRHLAEEGYVKAAVNEAWARREEGDFDGAIAILQPHLKGVEEGNLARSALGAILWQRKDAARAEPLLRSVMHVDPHARADLGHLLVQTGRSAEAKSVWRMGVDRSEVESMVPLANLLAEEGEVEEAEPLYQRAFDLGDAHAAMNLAVDLWDQGRRADARTWVTRAAKAGDARAAEWLQEIDDES
jgi:tetratricopeptide (TPR) repeat protein